MDVVSCSGITKNGVKIDYRFIDEEDIRYHLYADSKYFLRLCAYDSTDGKVMPSMRELDDLKPAIALFSEEKPVTPIYAWKLTGVRKDYETKWTHEPTQKFLTVMHAFRDTVDSMTRHGTVIVPDKAEPLTWSTDFESSTDDYGFDSKYEVQETKVESVEQSKPVDAQKPKDVPKADFFSQLEMHPYVGDMSKIPTFESLGYTVNKSKSADISK